MTAANEGLTRTDRPGERPAAAHPRTTGRVVLWAVVWSRVAIVETAVLQVRAGEEHAGRDREVPRPARRAPHGVPAGAGRPAAVARPPDRHGPAHLLAPLGRLHPVLDWSCCTRRSSCSATRSFDEHPVLRAVREPGRRASPSLLGMIAAGLIIIVAAASRSGTPAAGSPYETWHAIHLLLYAAVVLALIHQVLEGHHVHRVVRPRRRTGGLLWALALGALLVGRVVLPLWRNARHQLRVAAVVPESDNVVSVYMTGRDLDRLPARAGQFFLWRFLEPGPLVAGQPVLAVGGAGRPDAAADREGRRRDQRRAARICRSARGCSPRARTAPSPRCTAPGRPPCSSPAASASPRSGRCSRS